MDLFDIAILLLVLELVLKKFISERVYLISLSLSALVAVSQILIVGYKWQYMPLYIIILFSALVHTFNINLQKRLLNFLFSVLLALLFVSSALLIYYLPIPEFVIENKKYSVGYEEVHIILEDRLQPEAFVELSNLKESSKRELLVDVYYPSEDETTLIQLFKDAPSNWGETVIKYLNRTWGINLPTFLFSHLNLSYFDVGVDLNKGNTKFPVLIYTHGWAGEKIFATDQLITIASQGYVVIALDHTGLAMFTELPSGTIYNTGSTENSTKVYDVMLEMSIDIENAVSHFKEINYHADFSNISVIGHSTGGGSGHLYCLKNACNTLILQDPFFVPVVNELQTISLTTDTYFIYSEDWYRGNEDINDMSEISVFNGYIVNKSLAYGYYLTDSAHYDFIAFGSISPLTKYTFLKGSIDYRDSLISNNRFNLEALQRQPITTDNFIKNITK
ncbi:hypothetical protein N9S32_01265 [Candidatus Actinomarina]|nr:hypothetical protein [Candidatus Actinomarina sp.]